MTSIDLTKYGIKNVKNVIHNPSYEELFKLRSLKKMKVSKKALSQRLVQSV